MEQAKGNKGNTNALLRTSSRSFCCFAICQFDWPWARSIQPKFPEISVQNAMDRFGPTRKVSEKLVHLLRWTTCPGRTGLNFGWMDRAPWQALQGKRDWIICGRPKSKDQNFLQIPCQKQCFNFQLFSQDFKGVTCHEHLPHYYKNTRLADVLIIKNSRVIIYAK